MKKVWETEKFYRIGNNLSLDFINTLIAENGEPKDLLKDFNDFAAWAIAVNLLEISQAEQLIKDWKKTVELETALTDALEFREVLREMFVGLTHGKPVKTAAIAAINREIQNKSGAAEIRKTENGFEKSFHAEYQKPRQLLAPIAESAADLLCYGDLSLIKKCEASDCVLYFYDTTKNHKRRWCSMAACGNRAKAAAFYRRAKSKSGGE